MLKTKPEKLWNLLFEVGQEYELKPAGLAARDTLRLEMGFCLYGNEIDENTSPIAAGLGWVTKFSKNFVGMDKILKDKKNGTEYKLIAFELIERGIPRKDYPIINYNNEVVGRVTSGTMSPSLQKAIGLGYVKKIELTKERQLALSIRNKAVPLSVVKLPFYKN